MDNNTSALEKSVPIPTLSGNRKVVFGRSKSQAIDDIYRDTIENLKGMIVHQVGSVKRFCEMNNIDRFNLAKIFSESRDMSIGLYLRCLIGLGHIQHSAVTGDNLNLNFSLREYLKVDNNLIMQSIILMQY